MNRIKSIRDRLKVTQADLAAGIGRSQGNVAFYEKGQTVPPEVAKSLIVYARGLGHVVTFDDIYGPADGEPVATNPADGDTPDAPQAPAGAEAGVSNA